MPLTATNLKQRIITELENQGAVASGEHSWVERFAEAIATAVVDEVHASAQVTVSTGSSAGTYPVE